MISALALPEFLNTTADVLRPFDFALPSALEAHGPPEARGLTRDAVRLLVGDSRRDRFQHVRFTDIPRFLRAGDLLVVNDSATLAAALRAKLDDGQWFDLHLSTQRGSDLWVVEPRKLKPDIGQGAQLPAGARVEFLEPYLQSHRLWLARLELPHEPDLYLRAWGRPIAYSYVRESWPLASFQTIFARKPGSAEMPSAGRAFTSRVLAGLRDRGVGLATITLHTGVASLEHDEPPYEEWFEVSGETAAAVTAARARGGRVIAVGTTVVRALESAVDDRGAMHVTEGWTDLIITRNRGVTVIDGLLTGFHEPMASHLAMLEAIAGPAHVRKAYEVALQERYLWHEFGDLHLIL